MKKSLVIILALVLVFAFSATALAAPGDASEPYTSLDAAGGFNPTLDVDLDDATASGSDYLYSATGTHELAIDVIKAQSSDAVLVTGFGADFTTPVSVSSVSTAKANLNFSSTGAKTVYYTIAFNVTRDTVTKYYEISNSFKVYVGNSVTSLKEVTLTPNGTNKASTVTASGDKLTGHVDKATTSVTVTAEANGTDASATVTGSPLDFSNPNTKSQQATITVTAQNGQTKGYTLTVYRDYDEVSISSISRGSTVIEDDIDDGDTITYYYPYGTEEDDKLEFTLDCVGSIYVDVDKSDDDYIDADVNGNKITVEFIADPDGGTFDVDITVKSLDKKNDIEFTLRLKEADPVLLDDLSIMIGSSSSSKDLDYTMLPSKFDDETFTYHVFVPWDDSSSYKNGVDVFFDAEFDTKTIELVECNSVELKDGTIKKVGSVDAGDSELFTITLTDDDGNTQDYKVYVYYGSKNAADDASLKDLYVKYGSSYKTDASLSPAFSKSTYTYTASLPLNTKSAKITLKLSDSDAIIICNGEQVGSTFTASNLKNGANTFKFVVMAEDYDTTKTYTVTLNVGSGGLLSGLVFTPMSGSLNVSPAFSGDVYNYVANVANSVSAIYVTPTAVDSSYTISVYKGASDYKTVVSGKTSSAITLSEGLNEVKVYVYKSGSSKTYTLNIYRQPAKTKYQVSSQKITVNGTSKSLYAVNINGNNFLKLRDLAYILSGTTKQFNVNYTLSTNTAAITSLTAYVNDSSNPVNQPIVLSNPQLSSQIVTVDGKSAYPVAYNVAGSNYVNLRQVCAMLDIGLTFSSANNSIAITTANSYTPGL